MNVGRPRQSTSARAVAAVLIAALTLVRALIPTGYMLDRAEDGERLVVHMCSGTAARSVIVDLKTGVVSDDPEQGGASAPAGAGKRAAGEGSCPFALSAVASLPSVSAPAAPAVRQDLRAVAHFPIAPPIAWLSRPPLPGRGPPGVA